MADIDVENFLIKAEEKGKSMTRGKKDKLIISFHYNEHDYDLYLLDDICLRRTRYKVIRDKTDFQYVKHFTMEMFDNFKS